jgi:hypothetical protein
MAKIEIEVRNLVLTLSAFPDIFHSKKLGAE